MTIQEKTRELGEMIQDSEEMKKVKETEIAQANDEEAQELLKEFNLNRMNLARDMQTGKISQEEAVRKNTKAFNDLVDSSKTVKAYVEAKRDLDNLVTQINSILNFYITGEEPGCTHNCSSCGGCH